MRLSNSVAFGLAVVLWAIESEMLAPLSVTDLRAAAGLVAQVSATLGGFLLAVLSILATIANNRLLRNMQKTGHYRLLLRRLFIDAGIFGLAVVLGIVAALGDPARPLIYAMVFVVALGLAILVDVSVKLWTVLTHLTPEQPR